MDGDSEVLAKDVIGWRDLPLGHYPLFNFHGILEFCTDESMYIVILLYVLHDFIY